jgi:hypothetical protein
MTYTHTPEGVVYLHGGPWAGRVWLRPELRDLPIGAAILVRTIGGRWDGTACYRLTEDGWKWEEESHE